MDRGELANFIRPILSELQPATTAALNDALAGRHGIELNDATLEVFLRWLSGQGVRRNQAGTWSLASAPAAKVLAGPDGHPAANASLAKQAADSPPPSPAHLRTIERLRSGLPPVEAVDELSIDYSGSITTIRNLLARASGMGRWVMVRGQYGTGKTHFLQVFRSLALGHGYACCYLCADNATSALNHPLRFLPNLLGTLEVPSRPGIGYADLVRELLSTADGRVWLRSALERRRVRSRQPFGAAIANLSVLILESEGEDPSDPALVSEIIELLFARRVSACSSTPETREVAYHLLLLACDVVKRAGSGGMALLVDEAESVFTKLPTILSRAGATRVMSALCEADGLSDFVTAIAITPDADIMLRHEMSQYDDSRNHPVFEPVSRFRSRVARNVQYCIDCRAPKGHEIREVVEKVREFYIRAYPASRACAPDALERWHRFSETMQASGNTPRLIIRRTIDFLDTQRYATNELRGHSASQSV